MWFNVYWYHVLHCLVSLNYSERLQIMIHWYGAVLKSSIEEYKTAVNFVHSWWTSNINELPYKIPIFVINDTSCLGSYTRMTFIPISEWSFAGALSRHWGVAFKFPVCPHRYQLRAASEQWQGNCFVICVFAAYVLLK